MALTDWLRPEAVEDFSRNFRGIVYEATCPDCSAVLPLIFEDATDEMATLISSGYSLRVEVQCYGCRRVLAVQTGESALQAWPRVEAVDKQPT